MTNASLEDLANELDVLRSNVDQLFLAIMGIFVLFMQTGFAFLEAGSVRSKNTTNIIMKNVLDLFIGAIVYWSVGYAFAYGAPGNAFIGHNYFFSVNVLNGNTTSPFSISDDNYYVSWFFQYVFAATASTIVSGAMAERTEFTTYMVYCVFLTGFLYPVVAHWAWSDTGWLNTGVGTGLTFKDFAGSAVVHITGGTAALVGAAFLGPRIGRFNKDGSSNDIPGHTVTVAALGGFILFVGFLAFNGGSQLSISQPGDGTAVVQSITNTVLGGAAGAITSMLIYKMTDAIRGHDNYWSLLVTINGGLTGMVSMCAGCDDFLPWAAVLIGSIAGCAYPAWHYLMLVIKIDDPIDAVAVHLGGGLTGIILAPIFGVNGIEVDGEFIGGVIYGGRTEAYRSFGWNLMGAVAIFSWSAAVSTLLFGSMRLLGVLRVSAEVEIAGLDKLKHGEPAYPVKGYSSCEHPVTKLNHSCNNVIVLPNPGTVEIGDDYKINGSEMQTRNESSQL